MSQSQGPSVAESASPIKFLPPDGEELRGKLISLLESRKFDSESFIRLVQTYDPVVVRKVLPTIISRLIDRKTQDQARAEVIREAVLNLEAQHNFDFKWNRMYDNFSLTTASRTTEKDLDYVKRVFGDDYKKDLDLGSEVKDSKIRQLVPLGRLMEKLNLDLETIQEFLFRVRDQRCAQLAGTQGHRSQVTGRDLTFVKEELQSLMWTTLKRARDPMLTENAKKRKRSGPLSKEFIDDDADSPRGRGCHRSQH